ncbi:MAG: HEAT repeat domain-containing protein [Oscillatoria sp. SIO1A7]|nr:HEAT repeat domain-containing protein [Oscillatoria sp. SIO1A7]
MSLLTDTLNRLLEIRQRSDPSAALSLEPGLSLREIREMVKDLPIRLPAEVYELYQWRNGSPTGWYLSLQDAIAAYLHDLEHYDSSWMPDEFGPYWFQIFDYTEAEEAGYIVACEDQNRYPVVFRSTKDIDYTTRRYASLTAMMLTIAECNETGAYKADERGYLVHGYEKINAIWRKHNYELIEELLSKLKTRDFSSNYFLDISIDLSKFKHPAIIKELIEILEEKALTNEELDFQGMAARFLGEIGDSRAVVSLINALQCEDWLTRHWATISLGKLRDERAVEPLIRGLQDVQEEVRGKSGWALAQLKAVAPLIQALRSNDPLVRKEAAWALGEIKDPRAAEPLIEALEDKEPEVKGMAKTALIGLISKFPDIAHTIPF